MDKYRELNALVILAAIALILMFLTGCQPAEDDELEDYDPEPVLYAYLEVGQPFGEVYLEWVNTKIYSIHYPGKEFIANANIKIFPVSDELNGLDFSGQDVDTVYYAVNAETHISYSVDLSASNQGIVQPGWRYRIEVKKGDQVNIWAETTTPDTFSLTCTNFSSVEGIIDVIPLDQQDLSDPFPTFVFGQETSDGIELDWSDAWPVVSENINPKIGYVNNIVALEDWENLWPLDPDYKAGDEIDYENMSRAEMFVFPDYISETKINWLNFKWEGPQRVDIAALSVDYYLYLNSKAEEEEDEVTPYLPEINIHGGLGCFGAYSCHQFFVNVVLP